MIVSALLSPVTIAAEPASADFSVEMETPRPSAKTNSLFSVPRSSVRPSGPFADAEPPAR